MQTKWNVNDIPNLKEKVIVITGANSGIGFEAARVLAQKEANIVFAVRNHEKGQTAMRSIQNEYPAARIQLMKLDLSDLHSIKQFAQQFASSHDRLDLLINNAGVMMPPYTKTKDGFELQFGSNHLGHFVLTGSLLSLIQKTEQSRIVTVSSLAHKGAKIDFDNLDGSKQYSRYKFYGQSKLANLLFSYELNKRLQKAGIPVKSIACHPGISTTNLISLGKEKASWYAKFAVQLISQSAQQGAWPTLYAATYPNLQGGEYIGPDGAGNRKGNPAVDDTVKRLYDEELLKKLWTVSEELTGFRYL
jgi:NAD(P)-dependent dehydrogenase (short-subunit alcohol dehydrogenase family)